MFERIRSLASGRNVLISLAVFLVMLTAINIAATQFYHATGGYGILDLGGGANLFDDQGGYSVTRAYHLIAHYGASGIQHYYALLVVDIFFPASLGLFAFLAIVWGINGLKHGARALYLLALLPVAYTVADWSENVGITTMLANYPEQLPAVATWTNTLRIIKSDLASISLLCLVALSLLVALRYMTPR